MNKNSNTYIITYATIMVVAVAAVLAFVALSLGGIQAENVRMEKMSDILRSVDLVPELDKAPDKNKYIVDQYEKYITQSYAINTAGERIEGVDAFGLLSTLKAEYEKPAAERELPVFVSKNDQGETSYIIPIWGAGLWGPVWGYVALAEDWDTIQGIVFAHKGETPGLGAEITTAPFQEQFIGKKILDPAGDVVGITLVKAGVPLDENSVDGLTGGTLTCRGVENMIKGCLGDYAAYIASQRNATVPATPLTPAAEVAATDSVAQDSVTVI